MIRLSIIVPVYNGQKTIKRAIDSLLAQSEKVNIIVIDDGSSDDSASIVKDLAKSHDNIYYYYKDNGGISDARNMGVDKVDTEFFGFLDCDDYVKPDMAEKMLRGIGDNDICMSNFTWVYEDGTRKEAKDIGYQSKHELIEKMFCTLWNKIYRTSWFRKCDIRFPSGLRYEDTSVLMKLVYYMDKVSYVDESFVDYYQLKGSITHTYNININDMIAVFRGIKKFYEDNGAFEEYKNEIEYLTIRFFLGSSYLRACKIKDRAVKKDTLDKGWKYLNETYPDFKENIYLKNGGRKNLYFRLINKNCYYFNARIFKRLYELGVLK